MTKRKVHCRASGSGNITAGGRDDSAVWQGMPICGIPGPARVTGDPRKITCLRCRDQVPGLDTHPNEESADE